MNLDYCNKCRVCSSSDIEPVIDLGEQYLQGLFVKKDMPLPPQDKIPLSLIRCKADKNKDACGLLQTSYSVPPKTLYGTYWYRSGVNQTMRSHLKTIAKAAMSLTKKKNAYVLDIGCNDGTLLNYYPKEYRKVGIDPSNATQSISSDIQIIHDLFPSNKLTKTEFGGKFDIITSIAMYYDIEDPLRFARKIKSLLSPNGVWILEVFYLPRMLQMNSYDMICHEHLEYYSLAVIEYILEHIGLKLIQVEENEINGGSIRCVVTHKQNNTHDSERLSKELATLRALEVKMKLNTAAPYNSFQKRMQRLKRELHKLISSLKKDGKTIHIYGASTKGNTILQYCTLDHTLIDYAADRNSEKWGAHTLGTNIPIISEKESRAMKPDYYLVLPWSFKHEFIAREKELLQSGTKMIFPLPEIEIL